MISALVRGHCPLLVVLRTSGSHPSEASAHNQNMKTNFLAYALAASAAVGSSIAWSAPAADHSPEPPVSAQTFVDHPYFCGTLVGGDDRANDVADPDYSAALADATLMATSFDNGLDGLRKACAMKQRWWREDEAPDDARR